jgi:predicted MPP superfamily phosphohydrolase
MALNTRVLIVGFILLMLDWYFYQAIVTVLKDSSSYRKEMVSYFYWGFTIVTFLLFLTPFFFPIVEWPKFMRVYVIGLFLIAIVSKLIGSLFVATDDIVRLFRWVGSYIVKPTETSVVNPHSISRLTFLNRMAVGMTLIPFTAFIYGMARGAFNYKVHKVKVVLPNLPSEFNGLKILQISDIHCGSFVSTNPLEEAVKIINQQKADVVFFTGDLVNDRTTETDMVKEVLSKITAPMGVFSILGNHDYGDYVKWDSAEAKQKNLEDLKKVHSQLGWRLLMNEHVSLKKGDAEIALLGIENWGGNLNFPKYGDMKKAHAGTEKYPVKLLLSHDPSHWSMQVREDYKDVDITFSGHTHGFQFGIEIPGFKWSPSQYVYKQWAGLYQDGKQYVYVNRGLGFLGYPGRLGISPEITVMELWNV